MRRVVAGMVLVVMEWLLNVHVFVFGFVPGKSSSCVTLPGKEFPLRSSVRLCLLLSLTAARENNAVVFKT